MAEQRPTGSNTSNDLALITRAQNGDTAAFGTLIRDAHGRMWAVCLSITGNHQDAEDAIPPGPTASRPMPHYNSFGPAVTPPTPRQASRNPTGIRLSTTASPPG